MKYYLLISLAICFLITQLNAVPVSVVQSDVKVRDASPVLVDEHKEIVQEQVSALQPESTVENSEQFF